MSIIDCSEELVSTVDINSQFTDKGLSTSIYIDDTEYHFPVDYEDMALAMLGDSEAYPDESLRKIAEGLAYVSRMLYGGLGGERE